MSPRFAALAGALAVAGAACSKIAPPKHDTVSSFEVKIAGLFLGTGASRTPVLVSTPCLRFYNGFDAGIPDGGFPPSSTLSVDKVPQEIRGTKTCPYLIPRGTTEIDVEATALTADGQPFIDFAGPVSLRAVPGDYVGDYPTRSASALMGVAKGTIRIAHLYGPVRVWAEDAPVQLFYSDGGVAGNKAALPDPTMHRSYATGLSNTVYFEDPTIQKLQIPDDFDNRTSPLVGEFIVVGKLPESGELLTQSCTDDPARDTRAALMVVTGTDPGGFFVTDLTACRQIEETKDSAGVTRVKVPEPKEKCLQPDGGTSGATGKKCVVSRLNCATDADCRSYLPGTFGSMYVYNYSYPDGLYDGDLLFTLSGAVQEFTSTTQLVFPAWSIAEKVHTLPPEQWTKWLRYATPTDVNYRVCGLTGDMLSPTSPAGRDQLCGQDRRNMKLESLESSLVKVRALRFPRTFVDCDFDADGTVPFFCEGFDTTGGFTGWGTCAQGEFETENVIKERQCNIDCTMGINGQFDTRCSEGATFLGFGQFVTRMAAPGPAKYGLDESIPARIVNLPLSGAASRTAGAFYANALVNVVCDGAAFVKFGDATVTATSGDPLLAAGQVLAQRVAGVAGFVSVLASGSAPAGAQCYASIDQEVLINVVTKDAIPELVPNCREDDTDAAKATQCKAFHGATYDVVGHLRQVQPARPRWVLLPRNVDDVCCHPAAGQSCPYPIKSCATP